MEGCRCGPRARLGAVVAVTLVTLLSLILALLHHLTTQQGPEQGARAARLTGG